MFKKILKMMENSRGVNIKDIGRYEIDAEDYEFYIL